jgi:hypothetical protein
MLVEALERAVARDDDPAMSIFGADDPSEALAIATGLDDPDAARARLTAIGASPAKTRGRARGSRCA